MKKRENHWSYKENLKGKYGFWSVYGEDANCDLGGSHHMPHLGNFEGFYEDVWDYVIKNLPRFYEWGGGGDVRPMKETANIKKIKTKREKKLDRITGHNMNTEKVNKLFDLYSKLKKSDKIELFNRIKYDLNGKI